MTTTNTTGIDLIAAERNRQIEQEGWTPEHDDAHEAHELAAAAACYALNAAYSSGAAKPFTATYLVAVGSCVVEALDPAP